MQSNIPFWTKRGIVMCLLILSMGRRVLGQIARPVHNKPHQPHVMNFHHHGRSSRIPQRHSGRFEKLPLKVFPFLHELGAGWSNMQQSPLMQRDASKVDATVIDIGLDKGVEFFDALKRGFNVIGLEPNPKSFKWLAEKCRTYFPNKVVVIDDVKNMDRPLRRLPGKSYLLHAGAGANETELQFNLEKNLGTFVNIDAFKNSAKAWVPVVPIDSIVDEDIFMYKIDTQGFDHYVLEGSKRLFARHTVRQLIFEMDPLLMTRAGVKLIDTLQLLQDNGFICFSDRNDNKECWYEGDSAEGYIAKYFSNGNNKAHKANQKFAKCWDDMVCLNIKKTYSKPIPPLV